MRRSLVFSTALVVVMAFASVGSVSAQASLPGSTITFAGHGEVSKEPVSAEIQMLITDSSYYGSGPGIPEVEATPGAAARSQVMPIVDAISGLDGVSEVAVSVPMITDPYGGPQTTAIITLTLDRPTTENTTALLATATQTAAQDRLLVSYLGARFDLTPEDCLALDGFARSAAINDAVAKAGWQDERGGLSVGEIVSIEDAAVSSILYPMPSLSGCDPEAPSNPYTGANRGAILAPFDPASDEVMVEVYRDVSVTFALEGVEVATPAS